MMITRKGSIVEAENGAVVHVVNSWGLFGAGVAKAIAEQWPCARDDYLTWFKGQKGVDFALGSILISALQSEPSHVIHLLAMNGVRIKGNSYPLDYNALASCLDRAWFFCDKMNLVINIPKIGSGLAGGNWDRILTMLNAAQTKYPNTTTILWDFD